MSHQPFQFLFAVKCLQMELTESVHRHAFRTLLPYPVMKYKFQLRRIKETEMKCNGSKCLISFAFLLIIFIGFVIICDMKAGLCWYFDISIISLMCELFVYEWNDEGHARWFDSYLIFFCNAVKWAVLGSFLPCLHIELKKFKFSSSIYLNKKSVMHVILGHEKCLA